MCHGPHMQTRASVEFATLDVEGEARIHSPCILGPRLTCDTTERANDRNKCSGHGNKLGLVQSLCKTGHAQRHTGKLLFPRIYAQAHPHAVPVSASPSVRTGLGHSAPVHYAPVPGRRAMLSM